MTIKIGDKLPQAEFLTMTADGSQKLSTDRYFRRPQGRALRGAGRLHADLQHEPPAGFRAEHRGDQGQGRRYGRLRRRQ